MKAARLENKSFVKQTCLYQFIISRIKGQNMV